MNNRLIIAAAGSGKTTYLVNKALEIKDSQILITTFTEENEKEIINKFIEINGIVPSNVIIQTWFSFLLQHGVKPYQSLISEINITGLLLVNEKSGFRGCYKGRPVYYPESNVNKFYFSNSGKIYSDKIAKFVFRCNELSCGCIIDRLSKIYAYIFIDEIQDMAGYDLELIKLLIQSNSNLIMVGDPRQVTYHTHNEQKNSAYKCGSIENYIKDKCKKNTCTIDNTTLNKSYRNNKSICDFANSIFPEYEACESEQNKTSSHDGVFLVKPKDVDEYLKLYSPIQLRDSVKVKINKNFRAINFGNSKGLTLDRVLIYPTTPITEWLEDNSKKMKDQSRSKFYVAVTRAIYSTAIIYDYKKDTNINGTINFYLETK
jgi:DNA helicase-2/ATP-dependent DNA helicase PcrA